MNKVVKRKFTLAFAAMFLVVLGVNSRADNYSPYADSEVPQQVFFGDTHLHTILSADAGLVGNTLKPEQAYRFAKGETVVSSSGLRARLQLPLDFLVVSDHAENLGLPLMIAERNPLLMESKFGQKIVELSQGADLSKAYAYWSKSKRGSDPLGGYDEMNKSMWARVTTAADQHNDPGSFTAFIGYEWTAGPGGNNLHRNLIYRDGKDKADHELPYSSYSSDDPEDLWKWMQSYEQKTGGNILAIPHNGNLSNGLMFDTETMSGGAIDADYARRRQRWEPVYEVTQIKGDGETHPLLSPNDEFADYGTWDRGSFGAEPKTPAMLPREYAREALKRGMQYQQLTGVNPFKFGMIGSTDSHTGLSTAQENNSFGKAPPMEPSENSARFNMMITGYHQKPDTADVSIRHVKSLASGLAVVWAHENTRESIFDAFTRKEVYATTGSRIVLRVFAGWDFNEGDQNRPDFGMYGYRRGVAMGGDLIASNSSKSTNPSLIVQASRDPNGANLDRVQIVKGWVDSKGELQERVVDLACSDGRKIRKQRCQKDVGNTVNVTEANYSNSIGDAMLTAHWSDPDFDPEESAFYYVRVLEIPTPRWSTRDAKFYGVALPESVPASQQERAYSSPIWYTPLSRN
jgi:hypothetical protein